MKTDLPSRPCCTPTVSLIPANVFALFIHFCCVCFIVFLDRSKANWQKVEIPKYEFLHFPAKAICLLWEAYGIYSGLSNVGFWIKLAQSNENASFKPSRDVLPCIVWQQHKNSPTKKWSLQSHTARIQILIGIVLHILCLNEGFGCVVELWCVALWMIKFIAFII